MKKYIINVLFLILPFLVVGQTVQERFSGFGNISSVTSLGSANYTVVLTGFTGSPRFEVNGTWSGSDVSVGDVIFRDGARYVITLVNSSSAGGFNVRVNSPDEGLGVSALNNGDIVAVGDEFDNGIFPLPRQGDGAGSGVTPSLASSIEIHNAAIINAIAAIDTLYQPDGTPIVSGDTLPSGGIYGGSGVVPDGVVHAQVNIDPTWTNNNVFYLGKFANPAVSGPYSLNDFGLYMDHYYEGAVGLQNNINGVNYVSVYDNNIQISSAPLNSVTSGRTVSSSSLIAKTNEAPTQASSPELQTYLTWLQRSNFGNNKSGTGFFQNNSGTGYGQIGLQYQILTNGLPLTNSSKRIYNVGIGRDSIVNTGSATQGNFDSAFGFPSTPSFVVQKASGFPTSTYFNHIEVDLENSTGNSVQFYDKYELPNAQPSTTNLTKSIMTWTGNGSTATPSFEVQPKKYVALLNQTGTNAPVATVLENTLGGTVVWTRTDVGNYTGTLSSTFTSNKTVVFLTQDYINGNFVGQGGRVDNNSVGLFILDSSATPSDEYTISIEIRVYP